MTTTTQAEQPGELSNSGRRIAALRRKINRQHAWRMEVWATTELRVRVMQTELEKLGAEQVDLAKPRFDRLTVEELQQLAGAGDED